jgi:transcriptional regulator with XRE-family HTH domain
MESVLGNKIRLLRKDKSILLRQLAAKLDMDTALLSKMERGERSFKKEDVANLSRIFRYPETELQALWLADRIFRTIDDENEKIKALQMVLKKLNQR